jgi:hypothetical protein
LIALVAAFAAPTALADTPVFTSDSPAPGSDPAHNTPVEQLASSVASHIAQRPVRVNCIGKEDWNALSGQLGFDPSDELGFVLSPKYWWPDTRTYADSSDLAQLAPTVCFDLWHYGMAAQKPTKCATEVTQKKTVRVRVKKRVRINGQWVTKWIWTTKTVTTQVPGPRQPCRTDNVTDMPSGGWTAYGNDAIALLTLAHESIHLLDLRSGNSVDLPLEVRAECFGMQWIPWVAEQFGTTSDDAQSIALYASQAIYPKYVNASNGPYPYWSPDCHQDGPLDLSPGDGVWP